MTARRSAMRVTLCGLMLAAMVASPPGSVAGGGANRVAAATPPTSLSLAFNSDAEIIVRDPRGRVLRFGKDVPTWRNDFGATADCALVGGRPQVHIADPSSGTWKIGVSVKSDMRVLSLQGFTSKGCPVDDNLESVRGGFTYWWQMRIKLGAAPDTCRARLRRARPTTLRD